MPFDDSFNRKGSTISEAFRTLARDNYPRTLKEVFDWARDLCMTNDTYTHGVQTAVRYFMTDLEVMGEESYKSRSALKDQLSQNGRLLSILADVGDEAVFFGNSFTSAVPRVRRHLACPRCGASHRIEKMRGLYSFDPEKGLHGKCPACDTVQNFAVRDHRVPDDDLVLHVIHWPMEAISIKYNPTSDHREYMLDLSVWQDLKTKLENKDPFLYETTPVEILKSIALRGKMKFTENGLFHMRSETVSEISKDLNGWGYPRFMNAFSTVVMVMLLEKYNEVLLSDYKVPMRIFSPPDAARQNVAPGMSPGPLTGNLTGEAFQEAIKRLVEAHRRNPAQHHTFPYPLNYQIAGGEAGQLVSVELLEYYENRILKNMSIPYEVFTGSIHDGVMHAAALKLFERFWGGFLKDCNRWLAWYTSLYCRERQIARQDVRLKPVSVQENPEIHGLLLDLAVNKQLPMQTALEPLNIDYLQSFQMRLDEEYEEHRMMAEHQRRMTDMEANTIAMHAPSEGEQVLSEEEAAMQAQQGQEGGMPPPAGPMPPAPETAAGQSVGLSQLRSEAQQMAQQLLGAPDRASRLRELEKHNRDLHALVTQEIQALESQAGQQGILMAREQAAGGM